MRSVEEQMQEILRRRTYYKLKKEIRRLSAAAVGLAAMLIAAVIFAPMIADTSGAGSATVYGSTILGPEAGGYVIVALLAFTLGVVITTALQKTRKQKEETERS